MSKPNITRTYGPIHFEDLDPHRFEDLIRELIYDYKDWQSIEATGRSGNDEGFDVRAYEKLGIVSYSENENGEEVEEVNPMEGNLWMIQGKREKEIGPKKIKIILQDIDSKNPPYGYILAASANFSKDSYDIFRDELRKKGVMEFYLWGKPELEDMLHLPKNDRILFTFFGISLVSKRRTRTTEIRAIVNLKNKFYRIVGISERFQQSILVRDLKDTYYPYKEKYADFSENPRWKEYVAFCHHAQGILCKKHEYFAYIDMENKEWDFTKEVDFTYRQNESEFELQNDSAKINLVRDFWEFLPRRTQGYIEVIGILKFSDIALIDEKGDTINNFPHIYTDIKGDKGPFAKCINVFKINNEEIFNTEEFIQVKIFPDVFKKEPIGKIHRDKKINLKINIKNAKQSHKIDTIYDIGDFYDFLNIRDIIQLENQGADTSEDFIQITHKFKATTKEYLEQSLNLFQVRRQIEIQIGRIPEDDEVINILEFKHISKMSFEK